jgi:hypothetical protein
MTDVTDIWLTNNWFRIVYNIADFAKEPDDKSKVGDRGTKPRQLAIGNGIIVCSMFKNIHNKARL